MATRQREGRVGQTSVSGPQSEKDKEAPPQTEQIEAGDGRRRHACRLCSKRFLAPESLSRHMNNHKARKPHVCSHCSSGFTRNDLLTRHMETHVLLVANADSGAANGEVVESSSRDKRTARDRTRDDPRDDPNTSSASSIPPNITVTVGKRKRARAACDQCFTKRTRCDVDTEDAPTCAECRRADTACTFTRDSRRTKQPRPRTSEQQSTPAASTAHATPSAEPAIDFSQHHILDAAAGANSQLGALLSGVPTNAADPPLYQPSLQPSTRPEQDLSEVVAALQTLSGKCGSLSYTQVLTHSVLL